MALSHSHFGVRRPLPATTFPAVHNVQRRMMFRLLPAPAAIACCRRRALRTHATSPVRPASTSRSHAFALKPHAKVMFMEQSHCSVRLPVFCTCPPQCLGALWPMPAWVWRDVRSGFCYFFYTTHQRNKAAATVSTSSRHSVPAR